MALDKKMLTPMIIALVAVIAIVAAASVVLTSSNSDSGESKDSIVIEEGQTITQSQLDHLRTVAKTDSKVKLTYKSEKYTVVFDNKAIQNITVATDLKVADVAPSSLDEKNKVLLADSKILDLSYGANTDFKDGTVTISIPYKLASGQGDENIVVSYIKDDKTLQQVNCTYEEGVATFTTNHFSSYALSVATDTASVGLKVLGNVNGDNFLDDADAQLIAKLLEGNAPLYLYPVADANNDGTFDAKDVTYVQDAVKALKDSTGSTKAKIWHINYFDLDGNGTMDTYLVETTVPVLSAIATGSANTFSLLDILGIRDDYIKGACYGSSNDKFLYGSTFLDTTKVVKLGSTSSTITFEDGKAGSSDVIAKEHVTMVLSDWNRTYLTNEADFEKANVDVVRVAAASFEKDVYTHSIMLLGTIFGKVDQATTVLASYDHTYETINNAVSALPAEKVKKAVASSMTGYFSSEDSDYTAFCVAAGAKFALKGFDFGGSTSIVVKDNLGVFDTRKYTIDNIVHVRTALTYGSTQKEIAEYWSSYANAMNMWEKAYDGQVLVSGSVPVPVRVAYIAYAIYGKEVADLNKGWADDIHQEFAGYYSVKLEDAPNKTLALTSYDYVVTIGEGVKVTDKDGKEVASGSKFVYGTKLHIAAKETKEGYILRADGSTVDENGDFIVGATITARYVNLDNIAKMTEAANTFAAQVDSDYEKSVTATKDNEGLATITYVNYKGVDATKEIHFTYYDSAADAKAAYEALKAKVDAKAYPGVLSESNFAEGTFTGFTAKFSNSISAGKYAYSTLYLCAYKDNMVVDMITNDYTSIYKLYTTEEGKAFMEKTSEERLAYFTEQATKFGEGIGKALNPGKVDPQSAIDAASKFASAYTAGVFGTYTADNNTATAVVKNPRTITFTADANAAASFATLKATNETNAAAVDTSSYKLTTITSYEGLDGVHAYMKCKTMGSSNVSMLYVVAYKGDIVVDGATSYQYKNTGEFATESDINALLAALVTGLTA